MKNNKFLIRIFLFFTNIILSIYANAQWQQTTLTNCYVYCLVSYNSKLFSGTATTGVFVSINNGDNWSAMNNGMPDNPYIESFAISGTKIFAGTGCGIFLSTNNGLSWFAVYGGIYSYDVYSLTTSNNYIYAGGNNGILKSTDNGFNWFTTNFEYPVYSLVTKNNDVYCGIWWTPFTYKYGIYKSTNNGDNWFAVNNGMPDSISIYSMGVCGNTIFAEGLYKSTNNGASWISSGISLGGHCYAVTGSNIFAGGVIYPQNTGLFLSKDSGSTWVDISGGLPNTIINALTIHGQYIFAGTQNKGVWRRPLLDFGIVNHDAIITSKIEEINIFPNPAKDKLYIENAEKAEVCIYNLFGEIVIKTLCDKDNETIDLSRLAEGSYIVKVVSNKEIVTKKIMIIK